MAKTIRRRRGKRRRGKKKRDIVAVVAPAPPPAPVPDSIAAKIKKNAWLSKLRRRIKLRREKYGKKACVAFPVRAHTRPDKKGKIRNVKKYWRIGNLKWCSAKDGDDSIAWKTKSSA